MIKDESTRGELASQVEQGLECPSGWGDENWKTALSTRSTPLGHIR